MKANANQIRQALGKPNGDIRLYLLHGPDEAGARSLALALAKAMGDDAERIDLDGAMLKGDPARLADEAAALSLFGGARHIRVTAVGEESADAFAALLAAERAGNPVVAIAPTVKTTAKIVKLATDSPRAMAYGCYPPVGADAERMATEIARDHGLRLAPGVGRRLTEAAGGDRAVVTREIEKLALYLDADVGRPAELDEATLEAVGADLGEGDATLAVAALIEGDAATLGAELTRLTQAGTSPIPWLRQLSRRLIQLAEMRVAIDRGEGADMVMKRNRIHFSAEAETGRALRRWSPPMLARALARVREAEHAVMAPGNAGTVLAEVVITDIAHAVGQRG